MELDEQIFDVVMLWTIFTSSRHIRLSNLTSLEPIIVRERKDNVNERMVQDKSVYKNRNMKVPCAGVRR